MDLEELERLARAATPGPWYASDWDEDDGPNATTVERQEPEVLGPGQSSIWPDGIRKIRVLDAADGDNPLADAAYIAAFNPVTALKLLAVVKAANKIASLKPYDRNANNSTAGKWITLNVPGATWAELNAALDDLTPPLRVNGGVR